MKFWHFEQSCWFEWNQCGKLREGKKKCGVSRRKKRISISTWMEKWNLQSNKFPKIILSGWLKREREEGKLLAEWEFLLETIFNAWHEGWARRVEKRFGPHAEIEKREEMTAGKFNQILLFPESYRFVFFVSYPIDHSIGPGIVLTWNFSKTFESSWPWLKSEPESRLS